MAAVNLASKMAAMLSVYICGLSSVHTRNVNFYGTRILKCIVIPFPFKIELYLLENTSISVGVNSKFPASRALVCEVPGSYPGGGRYVSPRFVSESWFVLASELMLRSGPPPKTAPQPEKHAIA